MKSYIMTRHARLIVLTTLSFSLQTVSSKPPVEILQRVNQLFTIASSVPSNKELPNFVSQHKNSSFEKRTEALDKLSHENKSVIFERLADMLLDKNLETPFEQPVLKSDASQMDSFIYLALQLMGDDPRYANIRPALTECLGEQSLWRISSRLASPKFRHLIPKSLADKIFGLNLRVLADLKPTMEKRLRRPTIQSTNVQSPSPSAQETKPHPRHKTSFITTLFMTIKAWFVARKTEFHFAHKILLEKIRALYKRGVIKL